MSIKVCNEKEIDQCVSLHVRTLQEGLFYFLGKSALQKLYRLALEDQDSFVVINEENGRVNGVALGTKNIERLIQKIKKNHVLSLSLSAIVAVLRKPSIISLMVDAFSYQKGPKEELLFLFVDQNDQKKGIGRSLIEEVNSNFRILGVPRYRIIINDTNKSGIGFYEKNGFIYHSDQSSISRKKKKVYLKYVGGENH